MVKVMNHQIIEMMLREKREDLLREAERQRMLAEYEKGHNSATNRLGIAAGNLLIRLGEKLKGRYVTKIDVMSEACCQK
jgi:hypothetical protein